ncbi:MAG: OmpA family protein [Saprospiraceae bacterium]|nr:OmpA family protein [Saprospiraceae bacterium]
MTKSITLLVALLSFTFTTTIFAQKGDKKDKQPKPSNMWEVGANGGYFFLAGDVPSKFGYAYGVHVRKATDYIFSLRADFMMGQAKGENAVRRYTTDWFSGTGWGVLSLNNFRFDKAVRNSNYYIMGGAGVNSFKSDFFNENTPQRMGNIIPRKFTPHAGLGAGVAIRISKRLNIGVEHQAMLLFGRRADLLDGSELEMGVRSPFRDIVNYSNVRINYNIGNPSNQSEPLYWANPMESIMDDIADVKAKTDEALADSDRDGVLDIVDQEPNTPPNATVDTKGRTLDSDKDGVPDYRDREPYYPPRAGEEVDAEGVVVNPLPGGGRPGPGGVNGGGGGVTEQRVQEMIDEALARYQLTESASSVAEWFLPMIHFGSDQSTVKYSDYGTLASIGRMMKGNPNLRLVVSGYTDQTGPESYNNLLSYQRAKAVIEHLSTNHSIGRGRFVLQYGGKENALVPRSASYMNRRVEFRVATASDVEMDPPSPGSDSRSGY